MKTLRYVFLFLLLAATLATAAFADEATFNPSAMAVTATDADTIRVTLDSGNDAVLQQLKPDIAIPCDFAGAKVTGPGGEEIACTLEMMDGATGMEAVQVCRFQVARAGTYVITRVTPAQEENGQASQSGDNGGAGASAGGSTGGSTGGGAEADAVEIQTNEDGTLAVTFSDKADGPAEVEITVEGAWPGTVAVLVHEDGTEEVLPSTRLTETGVAVTLEGSCTLKIIDNGKTFGDVPADNWASDAIAFVSARELFLGTGDGNFSPDLPMTRGMLMTVLARLDGADASGDDWQEKGVAWAMERGVSDGSDPDANVTREQIVVMLWRMAGSPAPTGDLSDYPDGDKASDWAAEALAWAVENGIMQGDENGVLDPGGPALRSHVAQLLMNFINLA